MTIDEAIRHAEEVANKCEFDTDLGMGNHFIDRSGVADEIKCGEEHRQLAEWLKDYKRLKEQEPCDVPDINDGDMISRQAVLDIIQNSILDLEYKSENAEMCSLIKQLPSVKLQERTGHWEWVQYDSNPNIGNWHCSECRTIIPHMPEETDNTPIYKWCPICGARMEVEQNGSRTDARSARNNKRYA